MSDITYRKKKNSKNSTLDSAEYSLIDNRTSFLCGSPYSKDQKESRIKGKKRKYPTKQGWLNIDEISELTGYDDKKIWRDFRFKTMDQIIEKACKK